MQKEKEPDEKAPKTKAAKTKAPETKAPKTKMPEAESVQQKNQKHGKTGRRENGVGGKGCQKG